MEFAVKSQKHLYVFGSLHLGAELSELIELIWDKMREALCQQKRLEPFSNLVGVIALLVIKLAHPGTAVGNDSYQPIGFEPA